MDTINSNDRIAGTLYSLGTWFVSGMYVVYTNTLHKGDNDDDDDHNNNNNDDDDNNNNNNNNVFMP